MLDNFGSADYKSVFENVVGRAEVEMLDIETINRTFGKYKILIVGAGGTIGSALSRRLVDAGQENVFFLDRDESALHGLALMLSNKAASHSDKCYVGDIRDLDSIRNVFEAINPDIVIHAAALKHLVILEKFPREGYLANIVGSINIATVSKEYDVSQFINVSTDKAARPTSVLGYTKKIAEIATEEVFLDSKTRQCSVRFGNVFASRGSVIETFMHQIQNGLEVTLTHKDVARFFMSRNEAANLILAAGTLVENGTYIQNMGQEVLIVDVISKLAEIVGKTPRIKLIGLQSGEKMNEELYDGPTSVTKYPEISRSIHKLNSGVLKDVVGELPQTNEDALQKIENLVKKYL